MRLRIFYCVFHWFWTIKFIHDRQSLSKWRIHFLLNFTCIILFLKHFIISPGNFKLTFFFNLILWGSIFFDFDNLRQKFLPSFSISAGLLAIYYETLLGVYYALCKKSFKEVTIILRVTILVYNRKWSDRKATS